VKAALVKDWEIFDYACGQRLKPLLKTEVERLRDLGEIEIPDEVASRLTMMSSATVDRKLKHEREFLHLSRAKGGPKLGSVLKQKIPIRLTEWDTSQVGYIEADIVVHCGSSPRGGYVNTLSTTEISSGWWEGEAIMGKSQEHSFGALKEMRKRVPFEWKGVDTTMIVGSPIRSCTSIARGRGLNLPGHGQTGRTIMPTLRKRTGHM
jgi:hypothetical protein